MRERCQGRENVTGETMSRVRAEQQWERTLSSEIAEHEIWKRYINRTHDRRGGTKQERNWRK